MVKPKVWATDSKKARNCPSVNNWAPGKAILKTKRVITMPKMPSVKPNSLPGSISISFSKVCINFEKLSFSSSTFFSTAGFVKYFFLKSAMEFSIFSRSSSNSFVVSWSSSLKWFFKLSLSWNSSSSSSLIISPILYWFKVCIYKYLKFFLLLNGLFQAYNNIIKYHQNQSYNIN